MMKNPFPWMRRATLLAAALIGAVATVASTAHADDHDKAARHAQELREIRTAVARGQLVQLPRILAIAQARVPGEVVKVELEKKHKLLVYEVKILTSNGRVREVKLNARSGAVLSVEDD